MEPTLKQFRAFVTVAETGQITRAAERLGLSQSAVSTLIAQLEQNLGLRLFDRHTRLLRLTQAGPRRCRPRVRPSAIWTGWSKTRAS